MAALAQRGRNYSRQLGAEGPPLRDGHGKANTRQTSTSKFRAVRFIPLVERAEQDAYFLWSTNAKSAEPHCRQGRRRVRIAATRSMKWCLRMPKCPGVDGRPNRKKKRKKKREKKRKSLLVLGLPSHRHFQAPDGKPMPGHLKSLIPLAADKALRTVTIGRANSARPRGQPIGFLNIHLLNIHQGKD